MFLDVEVMQDEVTKTCRGCRVVLRLVSVQHPVFRWKQYAVTVKRCSVHGKRDLDRCTHYERNNVRPPIHSMSLRPHRSFQWCVLHQHWAVQQAQLRT